MIVDPTPTFGFDADEVAIFECRVDDEPATPCLSPFTTSPLADGHHVFSVTGADWAGHAASATRDFTIDSTPPEVEIESGPSGPTDDPTPTFAFSSDDPAASFECRLDDHQFAPCGSPFTTAPQGEGPHTFSVRAIDEIGNIAATTAGRDFTVDTIDPDTAIDSGPASPSNDTTPTFGFASNEAGSTYECRLDSGAFSPCSPPFTGAPLADGAHAFEVRAIDRVANVDPSPASTTFVVDTAAPVVSIRPGRRQVVGKPIRAAVACAEDCSVIADGQIRVSRAGAVRLRTLAVQAAAGVSAELKLAPARSKDRRRLAQLGRGGRNGRADLRFTFTDRAGNTTVDDVRVALRRVDASCSSRCGRGPHRR
jgi:hypothetical protein